jgi:hypothetical protein
MNRFQEINLFINGEDEEKVINFKGLLVLEYESGENSRTKIYQGQNAKFLVYYEDLVNSRWIYDYITYNTLDNMLDVEMEIGRMPKEIEDKLLSIRLMDREQIDL